MEGPCLYTAEMKVRFFHDVPVMGNMLHGRSPILFRISTAKIKLIGSIPIFPTNLTEPWCNWLAHVESDPDRDTIQHPNSFHSKDEIGVRIPGAPPSFVKVSASEITL